MRHKINISADRGVRGSKTLIRKAIRRVLEHEGVDVPCLISVWLTDDDGIQRLNLETRNIDSATDVLSFPAFEFRAGDFEYGEEQLDPGAELLPLGDIAISMQRVLGQAVEYGHSAKRELTYLCVHSALHLLGYDHLDEAEQKAHMRSREETVMQALKLKR